MHLQRQPYHSVYSAAPYRPKFKAVESLLINMPGYRSNTDWDQSMRDTIQDGKRMLLAGEFRTCQTLFRFLAQQHGNYIRGCSKDELSVPEYDYIITNAYKQRFAQPRIASSGDFVIGGRYLAYMNKILGLLKASSLEAAQGKKHQMSFQCRKSGRPTLLTQTIGDKGKIVWINSSIENMEVALDEAEHYFKELRRLTRKPHSPNNLNKALRSAAAIHWLYIQAAPILRGTAASTDMLTKVLLDMLDIDVPKWKEGLAPDLEALVTPFEQYVENYPNFFVRRPRYNQP